MKKVFAISILSLALTATTFGVHFSQKSAEPIDNSNEIAKPGLVAYAASYASDITNEPNYSTQNSKTFQYLNLGSTLNTYRGDSVKVGIIDSGINYDHEDFMVNDQTKVKGDSKYYTYQNSGWIYYKASQHGYSYIDDTLGHGTNVAATVAAAVNSIGGLGLAPNVELYVYKVTNAQNGYEFGAIQNALMDAQTLGIDVINMSFQSYEHAVSYNGSSMGASSGCSTILSYYLNQAYNAGITLVGAAGNYNTDEPSYPGSNNHVINVGSLNQDGTDKASFSNYGNTIDLVAPGYVYVADEASNTAYTNTQGTSFSAPLVTAAIALYKQKNPSATPDQIESALYASCDVIDDSGSQYTNWAGNGSLNVAKFLGVQEDAPTEIIINNPEVINEELTLEVGDTFDLDWTVNGNGSFDHSVNFYAIEDNGTLSVDSNGVITALKEGSDYVVIESNADSGIYSSIYVTVTAPSSSTITSVSVSPSTLNLDLNGTKTGNLTATVNGTDNPSQTVTWTSSNTIIATVSSSGVVTAKAVGNVTITATSTQDDSKSGTCSVTVSDSTVHVTGVSLNKNITTINVGSTETLTATVSPNNATNKNVSWTSSNTTVATVSSSGVVTAKKAGNSTITVTTTDGSYTATCTVTVTEVQTQTLVITRSSFSTSGGYAWYDWTQGTVSGKGELYTTTGTSMQFNKSKGDKVAALFNTTAIPGVITKISAETASGTNRTWNAYVCSTACSGSGSTLTFGSNKTTVGTNVTIGTSLTEIGTSNAGYSYFCVQENDSSASYLDNITITYIPKTISSISIKTAPSKTVYEEEESFNPTGLVITATYNDSSTSDIAYTGNEASFTFNPTISTALTTLNTSVSISYGGKSTSQAITVNAAKSLSSISISGQTTSFVEGDTFVFGGTVTAHFSDSSSLDVTASSTFTGYEMTSIGSQTVTVSYIYKATTKTTTYQINVGMGTLSSISVSGQTTEYVKNGAFSFDGVCTATFANGYQKSVTPTSISSPDMSSSGAKTVTISYSYNGKTVSTTYDITVNAYRTVMEMSYSVLGTITYPLNTQTISVNTLSISTGGYTAIENNSIRLGSGSNTGTVTVTSTSSNIYKVVVNAKTYGTDTDVTLTIGGTSKSITSSYADYEKEYATAVNSVEIATLTSKKRAHVASITIYTKTNQDIGESEDCIGLETFINNYMHMDYTENLGYCKDNGHHYYSSAKSAFNALNAHQRSLFTSNSAYLNEWTRLSTWATFNNESLNGDNLLASNKTKVEELAGNNFDLGEITIIFILSSCSLLSIVLFIYLKRKKEN